MWFVGPKLDSPDLEGVGSVQESCSLKHADFSCVPLDKF